MRSKKGKIICYLSSLVFSLSPLVFCPLPCFAVIDLRICDETLNGNLPRVRSLLDQGADIDIKLCINGMNPLMVAASFNRTEVLKLLLDHGAGINDIDSNNSTALMLAADKGNMESVKILLDRGAYINASDKSDRTVLVRVLDIPVRPLDRKHIADKDRGDLEVEKRLSVARLLVARGADLERRDNMGRTALYVAVGNGHAEPAKMMIGMGASVNAADNDGVTVLMRAIGGGQNKLAGSLTYGSTAEELGTQLAMLLIDRGADVNAADDFGTTPLLLAIDRGNVEVVKALVRKGVDMQAPDSEGVTPLLMATVKGNTEVAKLLINKGVSVNGADSLDRTPLAVAVGSNNMRNCQTSPAQERRHKGHR